MDRFIAVLLGITLFFAGLTYILGKFTKKIRIIKYIPGIIAILLGVYYIYIARQPHIGFEGLAMAILAIMLFWAALSNLVTGVIIDFVIPMIKNRKKTDSH